MAYPDGAKLDLPGGPYAPDAPPPEIRPMPMRWQRIAIGSVGLLQHDTGRMSVSILGKDFSFSATLSPQDFDALAELLGRASEDRDRARDDEARQMSGEMDRLVALLRRPR